MTRTALAASVACALTAVVYLVGWVLTGTGADLAFAAIYLYLASIDPIRWVRARMVTRAAS